MASERDLFEQFEVFLPPYLSSSDRRQLVEDLKKFPSVTDFYIRESPERLLQGDGWSGFVVASEQDGSRREVRGLIISNSCDVDVSNARQLPARVLFAPIVRVSALERLLESEKRSPRQITSYLTDIRRQYVTNVLFLPSGPYGPEESVIFLDDIRPNRLGDFIGRGGTRLFRLSLAGFYILILKLSIHFSRVQEGVRRRSA